MSFQSPMPNQQFLWDVFQRFVFDSLRIINLIDFFVVVVAAAMIQSNQAHCECFIYAIGKFRNSNWNFLNRVIHALLLPSMTCS